MGPVARVARALFGLLFESELDFPELPTWPPSDRTARGAGLTAESAVDVRLHLGDVRTPRPATDAGGDWFDAEGPTRAWFDWPDVARVRIELAPDGTSSIRLDPEAGRPSEVHAAGLRAALLGPVFTILLLQRGLYPLHASSVEIGGRAVAFAADSGAGKSTLTLALAERGHRFLSDDVTAVRLDGAGARAVSAYPQVKLLPDLLAHRGDRAESLPLVNPIEDKRAHRPVPDGDWVSPAEGWPLAEILLLEDGDGPPRVGAPLDLQAAFFAAVRHGHRGGLHARAIGEAEMHGRCAKLAERVRFRPLRRPRDLERLSELVECIERRAMEGDA